MPLQKVKYKKPSKINPVSVGLVLIVGTLVFLAYQYVPMSMKKGEAIRVLDEASSKFAKAPGRYEDREQLVALKRQIRGELIMIGVNDPNLEVWVEWDSKRQVRFGCLYSEWVTWPFDLIEPQEKIYELEYLYEHKF